MYECPNCSANLKYNISKQALFCEYCDTTMDPYSFQKEADAEENTSFGVTIFTCPQCGGELMTEDTTAATFCSFCGSSTILDSRISKEKCPDFIIPFSIDEEDCKKSYKKMMRRAIFAPKELSDPEQIKKFRGIYMPYWVYSFDKKGIVTFDGQRDSRRGDYIRTKHYDLDCDIDSEYNGLAYDASSTFYDSLSEAIAPFDTRAGKTFTPAYLSGFYADTSDVNSGLYRDDARDIVLEDASKKVRKKHIFFTYKKPTDSAMRRALSYNTTSQDLALFPVWFLSYQKEDRVAYAVINGQTGRAAADLPVDKNKYLLGSALLALPLFLLLNMFFTLKPTTLLWLSLLFAIICILFTNVQMTHIIEKETLSDDKGVMFRKQGSASTAPTSKPQSSGVGMRILKIMLGVILFQSALYGFMAIIAFTVFAASSTTPVIIETIIFTALIVCFCSKSIRQRILQKRYYINWKRKLPYMKFPFISILLAIIILIWNPVHNIFYYIGVIVCMLMLALTFTDIIECHNLMTTRKLPQLNKRGGDENA